LVHEAGGTVTDAEGRPLDFGFGRTLPSKGIVAAQKDIHGQVLKAVQEVLGIKQSQM